MADMINDYIQKKTNELISKFDTKANEQLYAPATGTIDEFRAVIDSNSGLARSNQFMLDIPIPAFLQKSLIEDPSLATVARTLGVTEFNRTLGILCKSITPSPKKLNLSEIKINGQTRRVPLNYAWDTMTVSFVEVGNSFVYNTFYNWLDGINNPLTNVGRFYDDYVVDIKLDYLNKENKIANYLAFYEAFPIEVSRGELSSDLTNQHLTTTVTFTYLYQTNREYTTNMLYNVLNNLTGGAATSLLNGVSAVIDTYNPAEWVKNSLQSKVSYAGSDNQLHLFGSSKK